MLTEDSQEGALASPCDDLLPVMTRCGTGPLSFDFPASIRSHRDECGANLTGDLEAAIGVYITHLTALMRI